MSARAPSYDVQHPEQNHQHQRSGCEVARGSTTPQWRLVEDCQVYCSRAAKRLEKARAAASAAQEAVTRFAKTSRGVGRFEELRVVDGTPPAPTPGRGEVPAIAPAEFAQLSEMRAVSELTRERDALRAGSALPTESRTALVQMRTQSDVNAKVIDEADTDLRRINSFNACTGHSVLMHCRTVSTRPDRTYNSRQCDQCWAVRSTQGPCAQCVQGRTVNARQHGRRSAARSMQGFLVNAKLLGQCRAAQSMQDPGRPRSPCRAVRPTQGKYAQCRTCGHCKERRSARPMQEPHAQSKDRTPDARAARPPTRDVRSLQRRMVNLGPHGRHRAGRSMREGPTFCPAYEPLHGGTPNARGYAQCTAARPVHAVRSLEGCTGPHTQWAVRAGPLGECRAIRPSVGRTSDGEPYAPQKAGRSVKIACDAEPCAHCSALHSMLHMRSMQRCALRAARSMQGRAVNQRKAAGPTHGPTVRAQYQVNAGPFGRCKSVRSTQRRMVNATPCTQCRAVRPVQDRGLCAGHLGPDGRLPGSVPLQTLKNFNVPSSGSNFGIDVPPSGPKIEPRNRNSDFDGTSSGPKIELPNPKDFDVRSGG